MARYIDADALIKDMRSRKYIDKALCEIFETIVDNAPTAYDVEAKVAELEKQKNKAMREYEKTCCTGGYEHDYADGASDAYENAIEIVQEKE